MTIEYLEGLSREVDQGAEIYVAPGTGNNEWFVSKNVKDLEQKAQRSANAKKYDTHIYRLVNAFDATSGMVYFIVRDILPPIGKNDVNVRWSIVETKEAAEMLRNVSEGPSPYFGAILHATFKPLE